MKHSRRVQAPRRGVAMWCGERDDGAGTTTSSAAVATFCRGRHWALFGAPFVALVAIAAPALAGESGGATTVEPDEFIELIAAGLDNHDVTVSGDVDLRSLHRVGHPVRCVDCTIEGDFAAADVSFERVVDLSGLTVMGGLDLHGATMDANLLLGRTVVHGSANLSHVVVGGQAAFDQGEFNGLAMLDGLQAAGATSFVEAAFHDRATFTSCDMRGTTTFAGASFHGDASFTRCEFARPASFRGATFHKEATFSDTTFAEAGDFTLSEFKERAVVDRARFQGPASFRLASIRSTLSLQHIHAEREFDLQAASVVGHVNLHSATVDGLLRLTDIRLVAGGTLNLDQLAAPRLLMDVESIDYVPGDAVRLVVLQRLEETTKERNDLGVANDARYALLTRSAKDLPRAQHIFDQLFYRGVAGYLVRPSHPLVVLLATMLVAMLVRTAIDLAHQERARQTPDAEEAKSEGRRDRLRGAGPALARGFWATARLAFRRKPGITADQHSIRSQIAAAGEVSEFLLYKTLLVLAVLAIGNSSPTFRGVLDALRA